MVLNQCYSTVTLAQLKVNPLPSDGGGGRGGNGGCLPVVCHQLSLGIGLSILTSLPEEDPHSTTLPVSALVF